MLCDWWNLVQFTCFFLIVPLDVDVIMINAYIKKIISSASNLEFCTLLKSADD